MDSVYSEVTYSSYLTNPPNSGTQEQEDFVQIDQDQEHHNQEEHENQDQDGFSLSQTLVIPQIQLELSNHYSSNSSPTSSSSSSPSSLGSPTISEMDELDHLDLEEFEMEEDEDEEDDLMDSRVGFWTIYLGATTLAMFSISSTSITFDLIRFRNSENFKKQEQNDLYNYFSTKK